MITVSSSQFDELYDSMTELMDLTAKQVMDKRDERRHAALLSKISVLKMGMTGDQFRQMQVDKIARETGLPRLSQPIRTKLPSDASREWREFAAGEGRSTYVPMEHRANEGGTSSLTYTQGLSGGYFAAPEGIHGRAIPIMKQYDELFDDANHTPVETKTGAVVQIASFDDTQNASVQVGETVASTETDIQSFSTLNLVAYTFRSGMVVASIELLQDSNFDWPGFMETAFALRHARGVGKAITTGSGSSAPLGLLTAALASGQSAVIASGASVNDGGAETGATSIGSQDLMNCYAKLNWQYRRNAIWGMADATLTTLLNLIDKNGRPLVHTFIDPATGTEKYLIFGRPVAILPSMPAIASGNNSVIFYDPNYFFVRTVPDATYVQKFTQAINLLTNGLVGFQSFMRVDSGLIAPDAAQLPCAYIQNHS